MPCWPDIWERLWNLRFLIGIIVVLFVYAALLVYLLWAPKVRKRWLRIGSRILGAAGIAPLVLVLPAFLFSIALTEGEPPPQTRVILSPDGQEAKLIYHAGFLGRDSTRVTLKSTCGCRHRIVFWHAGPSWFDDPKVRWLDNHHLRIAYHTRSVDAHYCENKVGATTIICTPQPWPSSPPQAEAPHRPNSGNAMLSR